MQFEPCPFCGNTDVQDEDYKEFAACHCVVLGGKLIHISNWNTRVEQKPMWTVYNGAEDMLPELNKHVFVRPARNLQDSFLTQLTKPVGYTKLWLLTSYTTPKPGDHWMYVPVVMED